jgi:hypothetical protein
MIPFRRGWLGVALVAGTLASSSPSASAQDAAPPPHDHAHMAAKTGWTFMQDGLLFLEFNHQGGPRGGNEVVAPNWWMGMASRTMGRGDLILTSMFSLDRLTEGRAGYRELFQSGETLDGRPLVDRQHPHDFFMQLGAAWHLRLPHATRLTLAGGPVGEPALGPVAFMHRASALDNPTAPLTHHTFDSTHISFGVATVGVAHGPWTVEGSVFNGREPDENRWDVDFSRLDSFSGRVWFRPSPNWELQVSTGHLRQPEALEPGDIQRTTASAAWTRVNARDVTALTIGYGRNDRPHDPRQGFFIEGAERRGANTFYGRVEGVKSEVITDLIVGFTLGGVHNMRHAGSFELGLGADLSWYAMPDALRVDHDVCSLFDCERVTGYGPRPISAHVFLRLRPTSAAGRMWNMRMSKPMSD